MIVAEVIGSIEGWTAEEWGDRVASLVIENAQPARVAELRNIMPRLLHDELERWR